MKTLRVFILAASVAILQLAGTHTSSAQINTNLFPASFRAVCISTNQSGNLVYKRFGTADLIKQCMSETGVTNSTGLSLVYDPTNNSLHVVSGTNHTVLCTPLSFSGGRSLTNTNHTRIELEAFVFVETNTTASGLLSATERLAWGSSNQLASFNLFGQLDYTVAASGTNPPAIYRGILNVGRVASHDNDGDGEDNDGDHGNHGKRGDNRNRAAAGQN